MMRANDVIPGKMYIWLGHKHNLNDYTRSQRTPNVQPVSPRIIETHDTFLALEVININNKFFDLKVLTAKGEMGYIFRWHIEGVPARIIFSPYTII